MDVCLTAQFQEVPVYTSACKVGRISAAPGGVGALPEGSSAQRGLSATFMVFTHQLLMLFTLTKSRREGQGDVYSRENPEVEMTETHFAQSVMSAWLVCKGRQPGKVGGDPPWVG